MTIIDNSIDAASLELLLADGTDLRLLDVRSPVEFEAAHIPGAYNVRSDPSVSTEPSSSDT
jgi:rhodanese-related sulfurtransferase